MTTKTIDNRAGWLVFASVVVLAVACAAFLRIYQIDLRPLHNDEGVNFYFFEGIRKAGFYRYSHENYHGPSYFYLSTLMSSEKLLGASELGVRSSAILVGVLTVALLLMLVRTEGRLFVAVSMLLLALSSSLTFYSRYAIHETLFLFGTACFAFSVYLWWRRSSPEYLYSAGASAALLIGTKETFIINLFSVFCAFLALGDYRRTFRMLAAQWQYVLGALLLMAFLIAAFFTGGFQWHGGLREMFLAVPQWIGRNTSDVGHFKSFWYYTDIIIGPGLREMINQASTHPFVSFFSGAPLQVGRHLHIDEGAEPQLAFAVLIPLIYLLCLPRQGLRELRSERSAFFRFSAAWAASAYFAYSYVDYKTPWLIISITLPAVLTLASALMWIFRYPWFGRLLGGAVCALLLYIAGQRVWKYNFTIPYGAANPYSYVHTRKGMIDLVRDIRAYRAKNPGAGILVGVKGYWPLPYYLHGLSGVGYEVVTDPAKRKGQYDVLILDSSILMDDKSWVRKYYRLSDVQESHTYFKQRGPEAPAAKN